MVIKSGRGWGWGGVMVGGGGLYKWWLAPRPLWMARTRGGLFRLDGDTPDRVSFRFASLRPVTRETFLFLFLCFCCRSGLPACLTCLSGLPVRPV